MKRVLNILIMLEMFFVFVGIPIDLYLEKYLPSEFQDYIAIYEAAEYTYLQVLAVVLSFVVLLVYIVAWVGLWRLWRPARLLYTICWLCFIPIYLFSEPVVYYTPVGAIFSDFGTLSAGMIFGIIYFSKLKHSFIKKPTEPLASPEAVAPRRRA